MPKVSKRGGFSDRNKIKPENTEIQLKNFDKRTRMQLQNMISQLYKAVYMDAYYGGKFIQDFLRYVIGMIYSEPIDSRRRCSVNSLYGYISDANGIRHAGNIGGPSSTFEEAKFMLVSCSAFVNYLIAVSAD